MISRDGLPFVYPSTIAPTNWELFIPYFTRFYEQIASTVNNKDNIAFTMPISDIPADIINVPQFGAFIICVSGLDSTLPTLTASLCKSDSSAAGAITMIGFDVGTGAWLGNALTITSTPTRFQIAHDRVGVTGGFSIRVIGTQQ